MLQVATNGLSILEEQQTRKRIMLFSHAHVPRDVHCVNILYCRSATRC